MTLILASASPARKSMLQNAGLTIYHTIPARIDEETIKISMKHAGAHPRDIADRLADAKAMKVSAKNPGALVLGCDQVLVVEPPGNPDVDFRYRIFNANGEEDSIPFQSSPVLFDFFRSTPGGPCSQIVYWIESESLGLHSVGCGDKAGHPICQKYV